MNQILVGDEERSERQRAKERMYNARRWAKKRGESVPDLKRGPPKGYKYPAEVIANRGAPRGESHYRWTGESISEKGGRKRALKAYPEKRPCQKCGTGKAERHHKDENTANNDPDNIEFLCRRCHMESDGRLEKFRELAVKNQPKAVAARWATRK